MGKNKEAEKATVASVLYRTTFNFLQILDTEGSLEIDLEGKGNTVKAFYQLKAFNASTAFLSIVKADGGVIVKPLVTVEAKKLFAKLVSIGNKKFNPPINL